MKRERESVCVCVCVCVCRERREGRVRERERERETYMKPKRMGVLDSMGTSVVSLLKQKCLHTERI